MQVVGSFVENTLWHDAIRPRKQASLQALQATRILESGVAGLAGRQKDRQKDADMKALLQFPFKAVYFFIRWTGYVLLWPFSAYSRCSGGTARSDGRTHRLTCGTF